MALMSSGLGWKSVSKYFMSSSVSAQYSREEGDSGEGQGCCVAADDACMLKRVFEARNSWCRFETKDAHTRLSARLRSNWRVRVRATASYNCVGGRSSHAFRICKLASVRRSPRERVRLNVQQQSAECTHKHTECHQCTQAQWNCMARALGAFFFFPHGPHIVPCGHTHPSHPLPRNIPVNR